MSVAAKAEWNQYLDGNFAPVGVETTATDLKVWGRIPAELEGRLVRIGPNPVEPVNPESYHWFTGTGMVHGVRLRGGRAEWYRSRFIRSDRVTAAKGWPETPGPRHGVGDNTVNTNVIGHAGQTLAVSEGGSLPVSLSYELDTVTRTDLEGSLPGGFTAHPKRDPESGELHAVSYYWEWDFFRYCVLGVDGQVRRVVDVPVSDRPMVHDSSISASYVVLFDLPVTFTLEGVDLDAALKGDALPYRWNRAHPARVGLLPREGTADDVIWLTLEEPCWVYHPLNAYDLDGGRVVLDVVRHERVFDQLANSAGAAPRLERWELDTFSQAVKVDVLDECPQEFPRHDERRTGRPYRYGYTVTFDKWETGRITKHDLLAGSLETFNPGRTRSAMEAVFVPRAPDSAEDEGWLLTYVYDSETDLSEVVIVDATSPSSGAIAGVELPIRVPYGFHCNWLPDSQ